MGPLMKGLTPARVAAVSLVVLTANAGYIGAFASPTVFYMGNVLAHLVIGIVCSIAAAWLLARSAPLTRQRLIVLAAAAMTAALGFGLYLTLWGNLHDHRWALQAHVAAGALAVALVVAWAWTRSPFGSAADPR